MDPYYVNTILADEYRRNAHASALHYHMVCEAEAGQTEGPWSKMLVKLAGIMIRTGEKIKSHAQREKKHHFPIASLQDL